MAITLTGKLSATIEMGSGFHPECSAPRRR
jgi:hypothetical protein